MEQGMGVQEAAALCQVAVAAHSQSMLGIASKILLGLVLLIHIYIALLETIFFRSRGIKVFRLSPERADTLASAMSNQGVYTAFLALALGIGLVLSNNTGHLFVLCGLVCVIVAGLWGGGGRATRPTCRGARPPQVF